MKDTTRLIHAGRHPESHIGAVNVPVFRASTILHPTMTRDAALWLWPPGDAHDAGA